MTAGIAWTLAALPEAEAQKLPALESAATDERVAHARHTALTDGWSADDARLAERQAIAMGVEELASIAALWPGTAAEVKKTSAAVGAPLGPSPLDSPIASLETRAARDAREARIPERTPAVRGPLEVYYYDHLTAVLGDSAGPPPALTRRDGVFTYEALNLVDGKRSIREIRDLLTGRYTPVPLAEVVEWFDLLAKAGVVQLRTR
jgi:hypothetical protein